MFRNTNFARVTETDITASPAALDAADGLPEGLIHPDFVSANVIA
jgi:hypothetical protein